MLDEFLMHFLASKPFPFNVCFRQVEAAGDHAFHVVGLEVWEVGLLDALHFVITEPVRDVLRLEFVQYLCIELVVVDGGVVVDELSLADADTEVATATCGVAKRMLIVGGSKEGCVAAAIFLRLTEDGATVNLHLRQCLLELALLRGSHIGKLVDVDEQIMGERHVAVELVAEVDVVHEVHAEMRRQESDGEGALATSLLTDEHRHTLVAVKHVHAEPVCHTRAQPCAVPRELFAVDAGQSAEEFADVVLAIPRREGVEPVGSRVIQWCIFRIDVLIQTLTQVAYLDAGTLEAADHGVASLTGEWAERFGVVIAKFAHLILVRQHIVTKIVVIAEEDLKRGDLLLTTGCRSKKFICHRF